MTMTSSSAYRSDGCKDFFSTKVVGAGEQAKGDATCIRFALLSEART
eukprot:CAMPEP_0176337064 /NCGR_PEP_ID=MMETSP0121_2-20121125/79439_1 /TAXON_ID=160619 /ORGANISM="Kryptoperidinium foliaceum, Strain CCMP 1326" /LENGTH=46 /DNA_ID= /DNA_START= /DNA_END= /DNA_ORIENTATION=